MNSISKEDLELLEKAAKAIGLGAYGDKPYGFCWTESTYPRGSKTQGALWNYAGWGDSARLWNPLTDDGDALRLAVELSFGISIPGIVGHKVDVISFHDSSVRVQESGSDPYTNTRRAIVRAAAMLWDIREAMEAPARPLALSKKWPGDSYPWTFTAQVD